jgi:hypothetical protein
MGIEPASDAARRSLGTLAPGAMGPFGPNQSIVTEGTVVTTRRFAPAAALAQGRTTSAGGF